MNSNTFSEKFPLYKKSPNAISENLGGEYEVLMCTYYSLKLCYNRKVSDFKITANDDAGYGKFDDVVLKVYFHNRSHTWQMQLKYQRNPVNITPETLEKTKIINENQVKEDNLHIKKFRALYEPLKNVLKNEDNITCILMTNRSAELPNKSNSFEAELKKKTTITMNISQFKMDKKLGWEDIITNGKINNAQIFNVIEDGYKNLDCFFHLLTGQKNCNEINKEIDEMLLSKFLCKVDFVTAMRQWWRTKYVFTRQDVIIKLAELVLSPFIQTIPKISKSLSNKEIQLKNAILQFDLTFVKDPEYCDTNAVAKIWCEEYEKLKNTWKKIDLNRDVEDYKIKDTDTEEEIEKKSIINVVYKFGLINRKPIEKDDLTSEEIAKILWYLNKAPLIVKYDVKEKEKIQAAIELLEMTTERKKLILLGPMLKEEYSEWKLFESLFDLRNEDSLYSNIVDSFQVSLQERQSISLKKFINSDTETAKVIKIKDLFLMLEKDLSIGKPLPELPVEYIPRTLKHQNSSVPKERALAVFTNPANIVIGKPGTGKSTLMSYLSHQCPSDYWCVRVDLIKHSNFLSEKHSTEEIMTEFLKDEDPFFNKVRGMFEKQQRMYLFLDGLDEISTDSIKSVLKFVKDSSSIFISVWISAREHLKDKDYIKMSPITIEELTKENLENYIKLRLDNDAKNYVSRLFSVNLVNTTKNILGIPLQLFIITEICRCDKTILKKIKTEDILVITKMYKMFFQGKEKHQQKKAGVQHAHVLGNYLDNILESYELPALETSASQLLPKLELDDKKKNESQKFLEKIQTDGDQLGIISQVVGEKGKLKAIFSHQTFALYFACLWLKKNQEKLEFIKDSLFKDDNKNLRLILDIMLDENNPLHLAVLYKNLDQVKTYTKHLEEKDQKGRNALHLICSYCEKCEKQTKSPPNHEKMQGDIEIIQTLAQKCNPFEKDKLFNWNCLDYALHASSLLPFEALLESDHTKRIGLYEITKHFGGFDKLLQKCCYYGYSRLLETLILRYPENDIRVYGTNLIERVISGSQNTKGKYWIKYSKIVNILKKRGYDINGIVDHNKNYSALHMASRYGNTDIIELLYSRNEKENIDERDKNGWTPLHHAAYCRNYAAVKKILDLGGDIDALTNKKQNILHILASIKKSERDKDFIRKLLENNKIRDKIINVKDGESRTPLGCACNEKNYDIVEVLREKGAHLDEECRSILSQNFYDILYKGRDHLVGMLLKNLKLEEMASSLTNLPQKFPIDLAKKDGKLQDVLLLEMAKWLNKFHGDRCFDEESLNFENEDIDSLSENLKQHFDNLKHDKGEVTPPADTNTATIHSTLRQRN